MIFVFYLIVFVCLCFIPAYGASSFESNKITVEAVTYSAEGYLPGGGHTTLKCKGSSRNQKLDWLDPSGNVIRRVPGNRVQVQEHFIQVLKGGRIPALALTINNALASDTGLYQCRSGDNIKGVDLCVIELAEFVDTPAEVTTDVGRSITLTCQAKGAPEPRLQWIRNGEIITDNDSSSKYRVMTKFNSLNFEGLLTIMSLNPDDSGVYSCQSVQDHLLETCVATQMFNVTLQVRYAPIFENGNDTKWVYGKTGQDVDLVCAALAFPMPNYRWYRDNGDSMYEYDKKRINVSKDNTAILTVKATSLTFGQRYKCKASNDKGDAEKSFVLLKLEKPQLPTKLSYYKSTDSFIQLNLTWDEEVCFPIDGFEVQYLNVIENKRKNDPEWKRGELIYVKLNDDEQNPDIGGILVTIPDLEEDTEYWLRIRATNGAGESAWSDTISASTEARLGVTEISELEKSGSNIDYSNATLYGVLFAGSIFVVAIVCMFAMRFV